MIVQSQGEQPENPPSGGASAADVSKGRPYTKEEVVDRVRLNSSLVVEEALKFVVKMMDADDMRSTQINNKASTLLGASGLSVTVAFSFGATLLSRPDLFGLWERKALPVLFATSLFVGFSAGLYSLKALQVRNHKAIDSGDVLSRSVLDDADTENEADGLRVYRRYLLAHIWAVSSHNKKVLEDKATLLKRGQLAFTAFIFLIMVIGMMIAKSAL